MDALRLPRTSVVICRVALLVLVLAGGAMMTGCEANPFLRRTAVEAMAVKDYGKAERALIQALQQQPGDGRAQYLMGLVRLEQGRNLDAQLHLERAWSLMHDAPHRADEPDPVPPILDALAESIYRQGEKTTLTAMLRNAASEYQQSQDFLRQADYLIRIGDIDGAKLAFRKAQRLSNPRDPEPYLRMAKLFESLGDRENTITSLRHAYAIRPKDETVQSELRRMGVEPGPGVGIAPERSDVVITPR